MKVLMVYTANMNLGDSILAENDYWLLEKALAGREHTIYRYNISMRDLRQIRYVDAVVFGGGILKSTNEKFWLYIPEIVNEAQKYEIPVFFSAIGCEAFHPEDEKSVSLKNAVNMPCVKGISCRDDIETLKNDYIENQDIVLTPVYDPAVWCRETYRECISTKKPEEKKVIGLGVVRWNLFEDYGNPQITKQFQLDFWKRITELLEEKGLVWTLFTNGDTYDEAFAKEVLAYIGHGTMERTPMDDRDLVSMISEYRGVIAGRMHSNIVAYALGISSIGFIWNRKLDFWRKKTGTEERFLTMDEMNAETAVERLLKVIDEPKEPTEEQKMPVYQAMCDFVNTHVKEREGKRKESIDYGAHMVAMHMGGMELRYTRTNSVSALKYSLAHGYRMFHLSVRLTSDKKLVCVDRWHKETYKTLRIPVVNAEKEFQPALSLEKFKNAKYYSRFETCQFDELIKAYAKETAGMKTKLFIVPGKPKQQELEEIMKQLLAGLRKYKVSLGDTVLCFEKKEDIETARNSIRTILGRRPEFLYYPSVTAGQEVSQLKEAAEYCKAKKIRCLRVKPDVYSNAIATALAPFGLKICIFGFERDSELIKALRLGADYAACRRNTVDYYESLTK